MARPPSLGLIEGGSRARSAPGGCMAGAPVEAPGPLGFWLKNAEFASRRAHALADYCGALARAPGPEEALTIQARFWNGLMEDYAAWTLAALAPFALPAVSMGPLVAAPLTAGRNEAAPGTGRRTA